MCYHNNMTGNVSAETVMDRRTARLLSRLTALGATQAAPLSPKSISFDKAEAVREACRKNICGQYDASWNCPPAIGTSEELQEELLSYSSAILFNIAHPISGPFDLAGMAEGEHELDRLLGLIRGELSGGDISRYKLLGCGGCDICAKCSYPDAPCLHPGLVFQPIEAAGIDVGELARNCGLRYNNGADTVTFFGMILFDLVIGEADL